MLFSPQEGWRGLDSHGSGTKNRNNEYLVDFGTRNEKMQRRRRTRPCGFGVFPQKPTLRKGRGRFSG